MHDVAGIQQHQAGVPGPQVGDHRRQMGQPGSPSARIEHGVGDPSLQVPCGGDGDDGMGAFGSMNRRPNFYLEAPQQVAAGPVFDPFPVIPPRAAGREGGQQNQQHRSTLYSDLYSDLYRDLRRHQRGRSGVGLRGDLRGNSR